MWIIHMVSKIIKKKIKKFFTLSIRIQNLSKNESMLITKKRSINDYKSMSKNELINAISILKPTKYNKKNIFKSRRKEIKEGLMKPSKKKTLKSKIKEIKEILHEPILNRDEKIEEIKKILYDPGNNLFKQEGEDHYKPVRTGNAFSSNYIEYKSNGDKGEILSLKDFLNVIRPYLSHMINDHKT